MLLGPGHSHVEASSVQHRCCVRLSKFLKNFVNFWFKVNGQVSVTMSKYLVEAS